MSLQRLREVRQPRARYAQCAGKSRLREVLAFLHGDGSKSNARLRGALNVRADYRVGISAKQLATLTLRFLSVAHNKSMGTWLAGDSPAMRWFVVSVLLAAACGESPHQGDLDAQASAPDGTSDAGPPCSPAEYDAGPDAALPSWAMGFFFANPPTGGSDALDVRVGPGLEYALAITGCDVFGTWRGAARVDDAGVWLLPTVGKSTVDWVNDISFKVPVPDVLLTPRVNGGLVASSEAGVSSWSAGLNCGCGVPRRCGCQDPFD
jgi:hypothetical protein